MKKRNPSSPQFGRLGMLSVWACLILMLPASFVVAQEEPQAEAVDPAVEKIAGIWKLDLEKSKEVMSEESFEMMSQMAEGGIFLAFGAEGDYAMKVGSSINMKATYTISAVEGEENLYSIVVERPNRNLDAKMLFMDENTVKFMPEGEDPAILTRLTEEEAEAAEAAMEDGMKDSAKEGMKDRAKEVE